MGLDGQREVFDAIRAGEMAATWTYEPAGTEGVGLAMKVLKGQSVPDMVVLPSTRITKDNADKVSPVF